MTQEERARLKEERRRRAEEEARRNAPAVDALAEALLQNGISCIEKKYRSNMIIVPYGEFEKAVEVQNEINNGSCVARRI